MSLIEIRQTGHEQEERPILAYAYPFERYGRVGGVKVDRLEEIFKNRGIEPVDGLGIPLVGVRHHFIYNHYPGRVIIVLDPGMSVLTTQDGVVWVPDKVGLRHFDEIKLPYYFGSDFERVREMMEKLAPDAIIKLTARNGR